MCGIQMLSYDCIRDINFPACSIDYFRKKTILHETRSHFGEPRETH